ncbi:MAG: tRNA (adenosine(37)-N6)-threonylcarbamoyltransferase complex dimerization subunit type 1 TsaB [Ruminococcaceae bacterium]|nr:tRNA (adenosine(37)-N6)-threonylcarbamoyltransferase complex dimerization subunit type 1 TsaB [Oscillospiraceae bacterium]
MLILAIDTSATTASAALTEDDKALASFSVNLRLEHSRRILIMIDEVIKLSEKKISEVELLCVSNGPGSFTGLRIGVSTVKGLGFAKNISCCGVSTLEALAENLSDSSDETVICPVMDARRDEFYNALFIKKGSSVERLTEDRAISYDELFKELEEKYFNKRIIVNGDGADKFFVLADKSGRNVENISPSSEMTKYQNALSVARVGKRMHDNNRSCTPDKLMPEYIRMSQAERMSKEQAK